MLKGFHIIKKYIPQREPMMMVDTLISHSEETTISAFTIANDNVLVSNGKFTEAGLLENMAQTAALGKGYEFVEKGEKPPLGFIGAVKNFKVFHLPKVNDILETQITIKHQVLNASIVSAFIRNNNIEMASCELKIFLNPEIN